MKKECKILLCKFPQKLINYQHYNLLIKFIFNHHIVSLSSNLIINYHIITLIFK